MKNKEKTRLLWKFCRKYFLMLLIFGGLSLLAIACDKDPGMPEENPQQQDPDRQEDPDAEEPKDSVADPSSELDPDLISEHLVLKEAVKITGDLPTAMDGQIKIDVKDTIFLVKGYPLGDKIQLLPSNDQTAKNSSDGISGMYVQVVGSSLYYDMPDLVEETVWIDEFGDHHTTYTFDIDLDLSDLSDVTYPFSTEVTLQPHDESGMPLDEFDRVITIEDPEDENVKCNDIRRPQGSQDNIWVWDFSIRAYNGEVLDVFAPGLTTPINTEVEGCCNTVTNRSFTRLESPACAALINSTQTTAGDMTKVTLDVDDFSVRTGEIMWFWMDGMFNFTGIYRKKQFDLTTTNFCAETTGYTFERTDYGTHDGTHDFSPGANNISLNLNNWFGSYRMTNYAELVYTCNTLMLSWGLEDNWTAVYKKLTDGSVLPFDAQFKPWFE